MSDWNKKKNDIAKAREYVVLEYERRALLQKKIKKGIAEKKLLNYLSVIWVKDGLNVAQDKVPVLWTIKRWYSAYRNNNRIYQVLMPGYGKNKGRSVIPESHQKLILSILSTADPNESKASLIRKIKNRLISDPAAANYSNATIIRFIKANADYSPELSVPPIKNRQKTPAKQPSKDGYSISPLEEENQSRLFIEVIGTRMTPDESIIEGDRLVIDKKIKPKKGDYVLAKVVDGPAIVRWPTMTPAKPIGVLVKLIRNY
jgi:hypothetical protein